MRSPRRFFAKTIAFIFSVAAFVTPAMATDSGSPPPDLSGQWGRDMLFFEPPPSGPGPVTSAVHKADGAIVARDPCCATGGHSVGWYEGDTLVVDTVGIKVAPFSTVDAFGTPHSKALHVVERYRLIDGEAAAEIQRTHGAIPNRVNTPYGRGVVDPDTSKKGLQVEFTVEDPAVFTTPWSGQITYRRLIGDWPEAVCAENPHFLGTDAAIPMAHTSDF
jgi:hypothetical protein